MKYWTDWAIAAVAMTTMACGQESQPKAAPSSQTLATPVVEAEVPNAIETSRGSPADSVRPVYEKDAFQPAGAVWSLNDTPDWYNNTLGPWRNLSEQQRKDLWNARSSYESVMTDAMTPASSATANAEIAAAGQRVLHRVVREYNLDPYFREADTFGRRMVIWLPEGAWAKLSTADKDALQAFMASKYANWGIGVGRQKGREVLFDRLVIER
jgi:hypothetical protein